MPFVTANGIRLAYERSGRGEPVLLIMGSGASGRTWTMHQTPALHAAGYETITFDNRGIPPSDVPDGDYSLADMVADTRGLMTALGLGPCRVVGTSLGAMIAQELAVTAPELVRSAVLLATRARSDAFRRAQIAAGRELRAAGVELPRKYAAVRTVHEMLSPATLDDEAAIGTWLEVFEFSGGATDRTAGGQLAVDTSVDRRAELRRITAPCRVVAYSDDRISPPHLAAEVADAIANCDYVEIPRCGHLGHLERPEQVNAAIVEFLDKY